MKRRLQAWGDTKIITIACCLVFDRDNHILLLQRHSEDLGGGKWGTPGGRVETREEIQSAALRELKEETGIVAAKAELLGTHELRMPHGTVHMTSYKLSVPDNITVLLDPDEHQAFAWYKLEDLLTAPDLLWGIPTILHDFGLLPSFESDPTLVDGSQAVLIGTIS